MQENSRVKIYINNQEVVLMNPELEIHKQLNEHTRLILKGIVMAESYPILEQMDSRAEIGVWMGKENREWFIGVVTYVDSMIRNHEMKRYQELYLEAMSGTCQLEQQRKKAAYQKKSMSYQEVIHQVIQDRENSSFLLADEVKGKALNRFVVQYEETDWDFLKRVASFAGLPLVASHTSTGIKFSVGVIWRNKDHVITREEEWQMGTEQGISFLESPVKEKEQGTFRQLKWCQEKPEAEPLEIGDSVIYQGARYYVKAAKVNILNHEVKQECLLSQKEGFHLKEKQNTALTGLSLAGSVKAVKNNQLQISLDVDVQSDQECWFAYSTFYSTFYCMPEKGDRINLYFPDAKEDHAFVLNSVRSNPQEVAGSRAVHTANSNRGGGTEQGNSSGGGAVSQTAETVSVVDATPYLAMLSSPEYGKLVNANVVMGELPGSNVNSGGGGVAANGTMPVQGNGTMQRNTPVGQIEKPAKTSYDFESMAQNEKIKLLCTQGGKMVVLNDEEGYVSIICSDGTYIALKDTGITITTTQKITLRAEEEIRLTAGKEMILMAEDELVFGCQETGVVLTQDMIELWGKDILLNKEE